MNTCLLITHVGRTTAISRLKKILSDILYITLVHDDGIYDAKTNCSRKFSSFRYKLQPHTKNRFAFFRNKFLFFFSYWNRFNLNISRLRYLSFWLMRVSLARQTANFSLVWVYGVSSICIWGHYRVSTSNAIIDVNLWII